MPLFRADDDPEGYLWELWSRMRPARPLDGCPGAWELKGPPGERGRWSCFGVMLGRALTLADAMAVVQVRRHDERMGHQDGLNLVRYLVAARMGVSVYQVGLDETVVTPALPGNAASLIVTVWGRGGRLVEDAEVRAL